MLHHLSFGVADLARSAAFYDAVLAPLGYGRTWSDATAIGYGPPGSGDKLALKVSSDDRVAPGAGFHLALAAPSRAAVQRFHEAALASGGSDHGAPGLRPDCGPHCYAAFAADPDGYRIEAVVNEPERSGAAENPSCPFCRIAADRAAGATLLRTERAIAFLDIRPVRPGHVLVVPTRHEADFFQLTDDEHHEMMALARQVARAQRALFGPQRVGLLVAGFDVPHAHLHVLPMHDFRDLTSRAVLDGTLEQASPAALADVHAGYRRHFSGGDR